MDVLLDYLQDLNWVTVAVAALAAYVVGSVWYSKPLFGMVWMKGAGLKEKDTKKKDMMMKAMVAGAISVGITATAFGIVFNAFALDGVVDGALLGILISIGFLGANKLMSNAFEQKDMMYSGVVILGDMASLVAIGVVFGLL
ncbi:MAG: DUF1761 domain-containing protein [bacterium]|nr:DUF1761 domain-containing protein [bacterium]